MKQKGLFADASADAKPNATASADAKSTADANADGVREFCVRAQPLENKRNTDLRTVRTQNFPFLAAPTRLRLAMMMT